MHLWERLRRRSSPSPGTFGSALPVLPRSHSAAADEYQGRGIATRLLERLASLAASVEIDEFVAEVMPGNTGMLGVFAEAGFQENRVLEAGTVEVRLQLEATESLRKRIDERDHVAVAASLTPFFEPSSIAVVGASPRAGSIGGELFRNVLRAEFRGVAFPVNRSGESVAGVRSYRSIAGIGEPIDLAVICLPGSVVLEAARDALAAGVRALCVISAGFAETGLAGELRQRELLELVRSHGARLLGPNCLGIAVANVQLNATFWTAGTAAWKDRFLLPEWSAGFGAPRTCSPTTAGTVFVRVDRQQGRRFVQRPARILGGRSEHGRRAPLPGIVRQSAQVWSRRTARGASQSRSLR